MASELPPQASPGPKYSFGANDKLIGPTIISSLTLPGLDLPEGTQQPSTVPLLAYTEARIELLKQANLSLWHALWMAARASSREAISDLSKANRHAVSVGSKLAQMTSPHSIRLLVLTVAAVAALTCEYVLSAPLIGPVFGFEPDSWQSRCLGGSSYFVRSRSSIPLTGRLTN